MTRPPVSTGKAETQLRTEQGSWYFIFDDMNYLKSLADTEMKTLDEKLLTDQLALYVIPDDMSPYIPLPDVIYE
jgi:hypothetical protein